jgi:hypothetical protein
MVSNPVSVLNLEARALIECSIDGAVEEAAQQGALVYVDDKAKINLTGFDSIKINEVVTLASGRNVTAGARARVGQLRGHANAV